MLAIAPHAAIIGLELLALENVGNQVRLVLEAAAKLVAVSPLEMTRKVEMAEDPLRVDLRFGRAKEQARSCAAQFGKRLLDAVIDESFEKTVGRIPVAIDLERFLGITLAV